MLAIEQCLIRQLPLLFTSNHVHDLDDDAIGRLAAENEETGIERAQCIEELEILEASLRDLKRLDKHRNFSAGKRRAESMILPALI